MLFISIKTYFLLKNNCSLLSDSTVCSCSIYHSPCRWTTINTSWLVSSSARGIERMNKRVQSTLVPLPWPLRGISSSLQGVWQACSPINWLG